MEQITVNTPSGHYAVLCRRGILKHAGATVGGLLDASGIFILSSRRVWKHWGGHLQRSFRKAGGAKRILFDDRESSKTLPTVEAVCRALSKGGADRNCILVALGGGVVGDVAGFVAASYLRGVRLVQVPTTLVAQADSAIGGKTGVNLPEGKNLVGAFYQPRLVIADPEVLDTLSDRQYRAGLYEVLKYGVIGDPELFGFLEENLDAVLRREPEAVDWILPRCIQAKARVVGSDEREAGPREVLNFGHTFAHAFEAATKYRRFLHGEAVGWGMIAASQLGARMKLLGNGDVERVARLIFRVGPLPALPKISSRKLLDWMRADKKMRNGRLRFVLPRRIGEVEVRADVPGAMVLDILSELKNFRVK